MKRVILLLVCAGLWTSLAQAQEESTASAQSVTISAEALAPAFGGFIGELGYNRGKYRLQASVSLLNEVPEFYNAQSDLFSPNRRYVDVAVTRFLNAEQRGFHYGLNVGYIFEEKVTELATDESQTKDYWRLGTRIGYFWHPFRQKSNALKGLFLEPAMQIGIAVGESDVAFPSGQVFEADPLKISGPLLHLGYKF